MMNVTLDELELLHGHICQALGDPKRILILYALHDQPRNVTALAEALGMPQPTVSRHLGLLRQRALVTTTREGASVIYAVSDPRIIHIVDTMREMLRDILSHHQTRLSEPSASQDETED
ncbi:MAG: winged helix-turn-helix transcriptional regulator [Anaerolinea sp.]|nr:winged helix-turn-helix transcriptional regulator [Anaerolinea sp.]